MAEQSDHPAPRDVVLEARGISKQFGGVHALSDFDLTMRAGEVVGLVGDNGAGKSTFVKVVSGVHRPTGGVVRLHREEVQNDTPAAARQAGIETVFQDTGLVDQMPLGDNFFMGRELLHSNPLLRAFGQVDRKQMQRIALEHVTEIGAKLTGSPRKPVGQLSGGQRASILIGRVAYFGSKLLLLDEPTAALGVEQSAAVLEIIRRAAAKGLPIIVISHNLDEVFAVSDRIVVLRLGRKVADLTTATTTKEEVVSFITRGEALASPSASAVH